MNKVQAHDSSVIKRIASPVAPVDRQLRSRNPERSDKTRNVAINLSSKKGLSSGDVCRTKITLMSVIVKATKIPEDMRSSKYENGTKVAMIIMIAPAILVPALKLPFSSISAKTAGKTPSIAIV
mmetsp:Transcript_24392/g.52593  ORF Transcript_24392/g.52593 Transcript_24392/m.52593 type:complete len:124 (+) Transcript_24392:570-941(+)